MLSLVRWMIRAQFWMVSVSTCLTRPRKITPAHASAPLLQRGYRTTHFIAVGTSYLPLTLLCADGTDSTPCAPGLCASSVRNRLLLLVAVLPPGMAMSPSRLTADPSCARAGCAQTVMAPLKITLQCCRRQRSSVDDCPGTPKLRESRPEVLPAQRPS